MREIERYKTTIEGRTVEIIVYKATNVVAPYYAVASSKRIDGAGKTIEEAKRKCESAIKIDIITNP